MSFLIYQLTKIENYLTLCILRTLYIVHLCIHITYIKQFSDGFAEVLNYLQDFGFSRSKPWAEEAKRTWPISLTKVRIILLVVQIV